MKIKLKNPHKRLTKAHYKQKMFTPDHALYSARISCSLNILAENPTSQITLALDF